MHCYGNIILQKVEFPHVFYSAGSSELRKKGRSSAPVCLFRTHRQFDRLPPSGHDVTPRSANHNEESTNKPPVPRRVTMPQCRGVTMRGHGQRDAKHWRESFL